MPVRSRPGDDWVGYVKLPIFEPKRVCFPKEMTLLIELFDHFPGVKMGHILSNFRARRFRIERRSHLERAGKANRKQQRS